MSSFEIEKPIPACHVSKKLLNELERYIKNEIPKQINVSKKIICEDYSISIKDESGEEKIKGISDYMLSIFPDSTNKINIKVSIYSPKYFNISINFNKEHSLILNLIIMSYESDNAREILSGIYDGIKRIIEPHRNHDEFFHLSGNAEIFFSLAKYLFLFLAFYSFQIHISLSFIFLLAFFLVMIYSFIGNKFKPLLTYETNYYFKSQKSYGWFLMILITSIITIIITFIFGVWEKLLVWIK